MVDQLTLRGRDITDSPSVSLTEDELDLVDIGYRVEQRVSTGPAVRGAGEIIDIDGRDSDVLEVTDGNGVTDFMSVAQAREITRRSRGQLDLALSRGSRGGGSGATEVVRSSIDLRQFAEELKKLAELRKKIPDPVKLALDPLARMAMIQLIEKLDRPVDDEAPPLERRKRAKVRGLYVIGPELELERAGRLAEIPASSEPLLVLLHGTFSHTEASFGGFKKEGEPTREWQELTDRYEGRLCALEHETLSRTPVQNALVVAERLPAGAHLHLLSHSRGGLVGDVLSYAAHQVPATDVYASRAPGHPDIEAFRQLRSLLAQKQVRVDRFVRVASPARGTILASRKVDRWATYVFNVLKLASGGLGDGVLELVKKTLLVLLDQRADVRTVPGIEAMMPDSPLVATLAAGEAINDGMFAVMGDIEGKGIMGKIALALPDLFFEGDHDLVVNTSAMNGGVPRVAPTQKLFKAPGHHHFGYFRSEDSRTEIARWLLKESNELPQRGTEPRPTTKRGKTEHEPEPYVVVVPHLMGTRMKVGQGLVWPSPTEIMRRGVESFLDPLAPTTLDGLTDPYNDLCTALERHFQVSTFGYDWRRSLVEGSQGLSQELRRLAGVVDGVVAHGAGCLVAQLAYLMDPELFTTLRVVMLDPPFQNDPDVRARRTANDDLAAALVLLGGVGTEAELVQQFAKHAGLAELEDGGQSLLRVDSKQAKKVAGTPRVAVTVCVHDSARSRQGPLSWGAQNYLSGTVGGSLLTTPEVLADIPRLLRGQRPHSLLPGQPGAPIERPDRDEVAPGSIAVDRSAKMLFPTPNELAALGLGLKVSIGVERPGLLVRVTHGDLRGGDGPWIVGAQDGTPIGGSEKALDERLERALTTHRLLGQYPGATGTLQLFTCTEFRGAAAAVIGLGDPGDLTPGTLTAGVTQAVLRLAAANATAAIDPSAPDSLRPNEHGFDVSCVLIGTVGSAALAIESSTNAIITGVRRANRRLRDLEKSRGAASAAGAARPLVVASLEIYELYEDRAVAALGAAANLADTDGISEDDVLQVVETLQIGQGGRKGTTGAGYLSDRWRTVRVGATGASVRQTGDAVGAEPSDLLQLTFTEVGRGAGVATVVSSSQRRIIDEVVRESIADSSSRSRQIHNTLYELIVPLHMKGQGRPSENIMFILDEHAAKLPLEMMATRSYDDGILPLAAEVGLIRRLETGFLRERVRPASGNHALVIGDPRAVGWVPLPGARMEALRVADALAAGGYEVERMISASDDDMSVDTTRVLNALYAHDYRIIHVAGHGTSGEVNGVVIGDDALLTAMEIQQMQTTPDLVFLNCCHLGAGLQASTSTEAGGWRPDVFAAGVSRQLIDNGVRAVVAAGWAVDDAAAAEFAGRFYARLLEGEDLGRASLDARSEVARKHSGSTTWGAYQIYGPPAFQLQTTRSPRAKAVAYSPKVMRERLDHLASRAASISDGAERDRVKSEVSRDLEQLIKDTPENWIDGEVQQAIGEVWRNLGDYQRAIGAYEVALGQWSSAAGLNVVDQIVSAHVRRGAELAQENELAKARTSFEKARRLLVNVDRLAGSKASDGTRTPELWKLQANYLQHQLWIHSGASLRNELVKAHECFRTAADAFDARDQHGDRYSRLCEISFRWVLKNVYQTGEGLHPRDEEAVKALRDGAVKGRWSPRAFAQLGPADCDLASHLMWAHPSPADVVREYRIAFERGASLRERVTIRDYLRLLQKMLRESGTTARLAAGLQDIEDDLFDV